MMKKLLILLLIPFLIGCGKDKESTKRCNPKELQSRVVNLSFCSPVRSLDPRIANEYPSAHLIRMLFEGLMRLGPDGKVVPGVAQEYKISEDQKVYTFYLRDSYWNNGDPVTAYDFEYAWKKAVTPEFAQMGSFTFYAVHNAAACLEGKVSVDEVGVKALDRKTLVVELEHPTPYFLSLTCCPTYAPINKKVDEAGENWVSQPENFISNGPFSLKEWKKNDFLFIEKNPSYWDEENVRLSGIKIQIIPDTTTQFYLYEKGKLDWVGEPISPISLDILSDHRLENRLHRIESAGLTWFFLNTERFPYTNKNFRKALSLAINRKEIVDHVLQMGERPATGILGADLKVREDPYFKDGDIKQARKAFKKALKELQITKEQLPRLVISCRNQQESLRFAQAIQQQWNRALGIHIEIEQAEWPILLTSIKSGSYQIGEMGWYSWIHDPIYNLEVFRKRALATNMSRWEHPQYKQYLDDADYELNQERRLELFRKAELLLMDEMPVIPINFRTINYLKSPQLKGVYVSPLKEIDFKYAHFSCSNGET